MNGDLARKLRHYHAGVYPGSLLVLDLRDALRDLQNAASERIAGRKDLRQIARPALAGFEKAAWDAHRSVDLCAYPQALANLEDAWSRLADLSTTVRAWEVHDAVQKDWATLVADLDLEDLLALPCLRIPRRLLDRVRSELTARHFVKAHFAGRLVRERVERMARQTPAPDLHLGKRIERIREEMIDLALPKPLLSQFDQVRRLGLQRYSWLARNLADDLETEHLGWRTEQPHRGTTPAGGDGLLQELTRIGAEARSVEAEIALLLTRS